MRRTQERSTLPEETSAEAIEAMTEADAISNPVEKETGVLSSSAMETESSPPASILLSDNGEVADLLRQIVEMMEQDRTEAETLLETESSEGLTSEEQFDLILTLQLLIVFGIAMGVGAIVMLPFWKGVSG